MTLPDVNVLVQAYREDSPRHAACRSWLESALDGDEAFGLSDLVLAGFLRVVTHPRIFSPPSPVDTHVWVWTQERPDRLGPRTRRLLVSPQHENWVSPTSTLEIARLVAAGHIRLSMPLGEWIVQSMADLAARTVALSHEVAMDAYALPGTFHQDPADRLLVAAAGRNGLTLVTADERILTSPHVRAHDARR